MFLIYWIFFNLSITCLLIIFYVTSNNFITSKYLRISHLRIKHPSSNISRYIYTHEEIYTTTKHQASSWDYKDIVLELNDPEFELLYLALMYKKIYITVIITVLTNY